MATILVPETYATINEAMLVANSNDGDTISIAAGTYSESIKCQTSLGVSVPLHFVGRTGNPADVIITGAGGTGGHGQVSISQGGSISHCTVISTSSSISALSIGSISSTAGMIATNCIVKSASIGVHVYQSGLVLDRCSIICTHKGTTTSTYGIDADFLSASKVYPKLYSCLVQDFNTYGIYMEGYGDVINCTVQTDYVKWVYMRGIWAANSYNNIFHNNSGVDMLLGIQATTINNSISYGTKADLSGDFSGSQTSCYDSAAVIADGNPVFEDEAADDFTINASSLAYQNGTYAWQTANSVALTDLVDVAYDTSTPAIGCYEFVSAGGGPTNSVIKSMGGGFLSSPFSLTP